MRSGDSALQMWVLYAGLPRISTTIRGTLGWLVIVGGVKMELLAIWFRGNRSMAKGTWDRLAHLSIYCLRTLGSLETACWQRWLTGLAGERKHLGVDWGRPNSSSSVNPTCSVTCLGRNCAGRWLTRTRGESSVSIRSTRWVSRKVDSIVRLSYTAWPRCSMSSTRNSQWVPAQSGDGQSHGLHLFFPLLVLCLVVVAVLVVVVVFVFVDVESVVAVAVAAAAVVVVVVAMSSS